MLDGTGGTAAPERLRDDIRRTLGAAYHVTSVRRIMGNIGLSPKAPQRVHASKAGLDWTRGWQKSARRKISRLEGQGFATAMPGGAVYIRDQVTGRKYWSPRGGRIVVGHDGNRRKAVAYGALAAGGRRHFRTHDRFDKDTFLSYLEGLHRRFGKVHAMMDGASPHTAGVVKKYVSRNPGVRVTYLPDGTPELNAMEEYWRRPRRDVLVSEYYGTFGEMRRTLSEYLRTSHANLDVMRYINSKSLVLKNF